MVHCFHWSYFMQTKMSAKQARDNFTDLLGNVYYGRQTIEIDRKGRVFAVVVNPDEYEALKKTARGKFSEIVKAIRKENMETSPETVLKDVDSEVEKVRQERYAK